MLRRCPWCHEPLPARTRDGACPHCGRPLTGADGRALRPLDLRYEGVRVRQEERLGRLLPAGTATAAAIALVMPLLHLGVAAAAPVLVVVHLVVVRLVLLREARLLLGRRRRFFTRWLTRLVFLWLGVPGWGLAAVPALGVLSGAATFAGLTWGAHAYALLSLDRERQRLPLLLWEKALLVLLASLTAIAVLVLVLSALLLGWGVAHILA